jgi:hypothetical protein
MSALRGGLNGWTQHFILKEKMEWIAMRQGRCRGFSAAEKTELWDRWQRGESLKAIGGRLVSHRRRSIFRWPRMAGYVLRPAAARDWH